MKRVWASLGLGIVGLLVFVYTVLPLYHMVVMALTPTQELFAGSLWPENPTLDNFRIVFTQDHFFLSNFWRQLGNSLVAAMATAVLVTTYRWHWTRRPRWTGLEPGSFLAASICR